MSAINNALSSANQFLRNLTGLDISSILVTLLLFIFGTTVIAKVVGLVTGKTAQSGKLDESLVKFLGKIVKALLNFLLLIICASQLGLPVASLLTIFGALGLAVSLAAQDTLKNLAGGIFLLLSKPFITGQYVESGAISGTVAEVGIIHTVFITPDNKKIYVPNGTLSAGTITNYSAEQSRRIDLVIPVPYDCSTEDAKACILATIKKDERVNDDPEPFVRVWELSASSVDIMVRVWTKSENYWELRSSLIENIKIDLDNKGISIPYSHMTVEMKK